MRRAVRRALAAALPLLLLAATPAAGQEPGPPDVPSGPATLRGRVVEARGGAPVPGAPVVLYALSQEGVPGLRRVETDAQGRFVFDGISNADDVAYLVGARHQGVPYPGERVSLRGALERQVEIRVAPVQRDAAAVSLAERTLRLEPSAGRLAVAETLVVENAGDATVYVPEAERGPGARPAVSVHLPEDLASFRMPLGVVPEGVVREAGRVDFWGPIYPGRQEVTWFYILEASDAEPAEDAAARPERFVWRAPVSAGAPLQVEVEGSDTRLEAPGASLEALPAPEEASDAGAALRRLEVRPPADAPLRLVVHTPPARVAPEALRPVEARLVLHADAAAVEVNETHVLLVEDEGRVRSAPGAPLYRIPLPPDLAGLRFGAEAGSVRLEPDGRGGLVVHGSLPPGESRVELAYRLPVASFPTTVERRFAERLPLVSFFLAETGSLVPGSERLHRRRPVRTQDLTYAHFEAFEVAPDETVRLAIDRQPPRTRLPQGTWMAVGGALAFVAIAFLVAPLWRARSAGRIEPERVPEAHERERQALYEAIGDLDHDFETGKVSAEDHATLRGELRARAVALLAQARQAKQPGGAEAAVPAAAEPGPCAECGARPRLGDRFCGRCGARLEVAEAPPGPPAP